VQASGSSLASMSRIRELDWSQAHVNDITMAASVLGLEAANALMYDQLVSVMTNDGSYIDTRHLQLLADGVMHYGEIMPVRRHGVRRKKTGWAHRASYEEIMNVLTVGAAKGEYDDLRAASGSVMSGQMGSFGSGWVGLLDAEAAGGAPCGSWSSERSEGAWKDPELQLNPLNPEHVTDIRGRAPDPRFMDGRTGTVQHRAVRQLRRLHDERVSRGGRPAASSSAFPTPVPMVGPKHRYTAAGAIAAMTYEGHGSVRDYISDSMPHTVVDPDGGAQQQQQQQQQQEQEFDDDGYVTIGAPPAGPAATAASSPGTSPQAPPSSSTSFAGLEATLLTRTGALRMIHPLSSGAAKRGASHA
jgi:hypothetical protein